MRYALIIVLGACYFLGWLPASFAVPALMAVSLLRPRAAGPTPRRGGYIAPQPSVSGGESPVMVDRVRTYTDSFRQPGPLSEVRTAFTAPLGLSKTSEPGSYMSSWGFAPGRLTTAAKPYFSVRREFRPDGTLTGWGPNEARPPGDCGCGDTAA